MIGYLKGRVRDVCKSDVFIDCNGVGYRVETGSIDGYHLGDEVEFYIHTHVRENELKLYGFKSLKDLSLFEMLIGVSGVGPKVAMLLITQLGMQSIVNCILHKDTEGLKVRGVGMKTADKIILELIDKLRKGGYEVDTYRGARVGGQELERKFDDVAGALKNLGYSALDIREMMKDARETEEFQAMSIQDMIKYLLSKKQ